MIYKLVLCFGKVTFDKDATECSSNPNRHGILLQHNPERNLVTLLAVNHQIYEEARRVLYSLNSFVFPAPKNNPDIPNRYRTG
ncbi:hypothetical protein BDV26DRAFT_261561 [Aspergillus bertholletiae]|uniref:Uncharacterized protein n=1 Tax=Aspergillus bertholletiae TaxID=1226010 RepID=A0A5N7B9T6_9EURO|nr:hypothetical protein BDV26DRAFT_261561 [Aspergillus bertholletiae]